MSQPMGTVVLYVLVSSMIQNCYLRSSQHNVDQDGEMHSWGEGVGNTSASVTSLPQLRWTNATGRGLSARVPLVKSSEGATTKGTISPVRPGPGSSSEAFLSSSTPRTALPTEEAPTVLSPLDLERAGEGSGTAAPTESSAQGPPGVTKQPSGMWGTEVPAHRAKAYSLPSGTTTGTVPLSTQRKQENATQPSVTTARKKSPTDSRWLSGLDQHDIPVVVGVSVSLALIFVSMGVYSFRQKTENIKVNSTSSPKSSRSRRGRNYLEVDGTHENRAFEVECVVDAVEQNPYETSASPSLLGSGSGSALPAEAAEHQKEAPVAAAGEVWLTAQPKAGDCLGARQQEATCTETHPGPHEAAPSAAPMLSESSRSRKPCAVTPGMCTAASPALQHIGTTLYFHGPKSLCWSTAPFERGTSWSSGQVPAGPAPAGGMEEYSPPGDQSSPRTAVMSVSVEIHLYPCTTETSSAPAAAQTVSDSSHPEAARAASQHPASLLGPGPRSFL